MVSGCDLVYPVPATVQTQGDFLFTIIPSNPAYWTGTRIAQVAPAYMTYRPLRMTFSYIPQVAVTQAGTVAMGTLWNGASGDADLQQTLFTSNGGCLTQCYVPCDTTIRLGANLQQNLFTLSGSLEPDTSPFIFCAALRGATVVPGYFYVSYEYEFKNPVGQSWTYARSDVIEASAITPQAYPNSSVILLSQDGAYGPGTIFDLEGTALYYHGTPVTLSAAAPVQIFSNGQTQGVEAVNQTLRARITGLEHPVITSYSQGGVVSQLVLTPGELEGANFGVTPSGDTWRYQFAPSLASTTTYRARIEDTATSLRLLTAEGDVVARLPFGNQVFLTATAVLPTDLD